MPWLLVPVLETLFPFGILRVVWLGGEDCVVLVKRVLMV